MLPLPMWMFSCPYFRVLLDFAFLELLGMLNCWWKLNFWLKKKKKKLFIPSKEMMKILTSACPHIIFFFIIFVSANRASGFISWISETNQETLDRGVKTRTVRSILSPVCTTYNEGTEPSITLHLQPGYFLTDTSNKALALNSWFSSLMLVIFKTRQFVSTHFIKPF